MNATLRSPIVALAATLTLLLAAGAWFYDAQERRMRRDAGENLQTIAKLKVDLIARWRAERLADAAVLAESPLLIAGMQAWLKDPRPELAEPILTPFRALRKHVSYQDVLLVDPGGQVRLSVTGKQGPLHEDAIRATAEAIAGHRCVLSELHAGPGGLPPHLDVVAPLFSQPGQAGKPVGAVILRCDAAGSLYPLIQTWPIPSLSAETLLVRRDGDAVLYLNDLRYQRGTALKLRIPMTRKDLPAVMAVEGRKGIVEGKDYRGVPVLSVLEAVPDSSWFMVVKVDAAEALSAWRDRAFLIVTVILGLAMAAAAATAAVWQRNQKAHYRALLHAEVARHESEEEYRRLHESMRDAFCKVDMKGRLSGSNPAYREMLGYTEEELSRLTFVDLTPARWHTMEQRLVEEQILPRGYSDVYEKEYIRKDGTVLPVELRTFLIRDAAGQPVTMWAIIRDITDRKRAEAALAEETARRRILFEQSPDAVLVLDPPTGRFLEFNTTAHRQLGYSREEFAQLTVFDVEAVETPEETRARFAQVIREGRVDFETRQRTKQGAIRDVLVTGQTVDIMGRQVYHCVWRDITDRKELEQKLLQAQKMEAIGQLAGGVAHDFRNQLTIIKGYGEMLLRRGLVKDEGLDKLAEILKAADRSALLTGQLLAFSRKQTLDVRPVDLTDLIVEVSKVIPRMVGEDVRVVVVPCSKPCPVEIDPGQLQHAILNLVANARDAMPNGGELRIQTLRGQVPQAAAAGAEPAAPGPYAGLAVSDSGCGMDEATLAHIFEPFFTTKEVGKGTGLGLAMVYGFVQQSGGVIDVQSQPGKGTTFTLYFPLATAAPQASGLLAGTAQPLPGGTETILVVEDESPVRRMLVESLGEAGYTVLAASRIAEAWAIMEHSKARIDLLITDVIMPEGSGVDLARRVRQDRPEVKIVFITGYAGAELSNRGVPLDSANTVTKPCDHDSLLRRIRAVLDGASGKT